MRRLSVHAQRKEVRDTPRDQDVRDDSNLLLWLRALGDRSRLYLFHRHPHPAEVVAHQSFPVVAGCAHRKINRHSRPSGVQQPCVLPIRDHKALRPPFVIQCNQSSNKFGDAQAVAGQCNVDIFPSFPDGIHDNRDDKFLDCSLRAIPQVIEALSFREFRFSPVENGEYTFRPMLLIRKSGLTMCSPHIPFRDTEALFPEKWRGDQLRAGRLGLGQLNRFGGVICAEGRGSNDVGEGCRREEFSNGFGLLRFQLDWRSLNIE